MGPLSEVLSLLKPRSYGSAGFDAGGNWGSVAIVEAGRAKPGTGWGSKGQGVELLGGGRGVVFEAVELAFLDHVHGLDAGDQGARAAKGLEPEHGSHDALDGPVILLDDVVEVLALPHLDVGAGVGTNALDGSGVGAALVDGDLVGDAM